MEFLGTDLALACCLLGQHPEQSRGISNTFELDSILDEVMKHLNEPVVKPIATNVIDICGTCISIRLANSNATILGSTLAPEERRCRNDD
jgi:hypothetical protein